MLKWLTILAVGMMLVASGGAQAQRNSGTATLTALDYAEIQRPYAAYAHAVNL